jgi:NAD(P)-dependent dehydrogenase (short-subunit alcohol dehydrogenase family)
MNHSEGRLQGKVALVSGAASGIGAAVAERLRREGAIVVGADVQAIGGGEGATDENSGDGARCDVTDASSCEAAVSAVLERHGQLDILANVAGVGQSFPIGEMPLEVWKRIVDVNLTGTFLLSQKALPALLASRGCIVNMASVAGLRATPYNAAYCASKGGVIMLTKSMAIELAKAGVRVNAVCPAAVDTPFLRNFELPAGADLELLARASSPMGKLVGVDEVAGAVAYLASDDAATISGTTLVLDGAATA